MMESLKRDLALDLVRRDKRSDMVTGRSDLLPPYVLLQPFTDCMTPGKLLDLSVPWALHYNIALIVAYILQCCFEIK